jgi:hypothetical protein
MYQFIIYLTDDYLGENLTIKTERSQENMLKYGERDKKHLLHTMYPRKLSDACEPRSNYGVIFPKNCIHYTDELLHGNKIILIVDCEIV